MHSVSIKLTNSILIGALVVAAVALFTLWSGQRLSLASAFLSSIVAFLLMAVGMALLSPVALLFSATGREAPTPPAGAILEEN